VSWQRDIWTGQRPPLPQLEQKIIARVRLFHFDPKDVESVTTTKPIDFFPA